MDLISFLTVKFNIRVTFLKYTLKKLTFILILVI